MINVFKIPKFWDNEYCKLDYTNEEFNDDENVKYWLDIGFANKFTGDMCDMRQQQPTWNTGFVKLFEEMGWQDIGTSYYRMDTGTVLPEHSDLYARYIQLFNLQGQESTICRSIVFLEEWSSGHYSECAREPIVNWTAGDVIEWKYNTPHMAANLGLKPRYTLQITGHL